MHGVRRTKPTESPAARRLKEAPKIAEYRALVDDVLARNQQQVFDSETLELTSRALKLNPELYTAWNVRRRSLLALFESLSLEDRLARLLADINLTTSILKSLPKVYWIWNHRLWCLSNVPYGPSAGAAPSSSDAASSSTGGGEAVQAQSQEAAQAPAADAARDTTWKREAWERELLLVDKMLSADPRNFHAWDYRRHVLESLAALSSDPPETARARECRQELAFTRRKIEANFSNFSAWHQRMRVLGEGAFASDDESEAEFELVNQALWTDPNDQSSWLYHRFLVHKTGNDAAVVDREMALLRELHEMEPDAKWPMDSLVHYSLLLLALPAAGGAADDGRRAERRADVRAWLARLEDVDPARQERWRSLALKLV